jgi:hypothetical protein
MSGKPKGQLVRLQPVSEDTDAGGPVRTPHGTPLEQINFRCSRDMARELLRAAEVAGGMRQLIARHAKGAGLAIPEWDLGGSARQRRRFE